MFTNMKIKKNKAIYALTAFILIVLIAVGYFIFLKLTEPNVNYQNFEINVKPTSSTVSSENNETQKKVDNPIDFTSLQAINTDIYAWIIVPNTNIDYPILQSYSEDDFFYLSRNIYKQYEFAGSIYTEKNNKKDFSDPNTVIYGHDMLNGSMFQNLHKFSDSAFFDSNEYFYIYTPSRKLTYHIFSAYIYDDRHILNSFDFSDKEVFAKYIEEARDPKSTNKNTRKSVEVTADDKIVTLSTCVGYDANARYLVQGVLVKDEPTR